MSTPNHDTELEEILHATIGIGYAGKPPHNQNSPKKVVGHKEAVKALNSYLYKHILELIGEPEEIYKYKIADASHQLIQKNLWKLELRKAAAERWGQ